MYINPSIVVLYFAITGVSASPFSFKFAFDITSINNFGFNKSPFGRSGFSFSSNCFKTLSSYKNFNNYDRKTNNCGAPAYVYSHKTIPKSNPQIPNLCTSDTVRQYHVLLNAQLMSIIPERLQMAQRQRFSLLQASR
jgi:hypothetical protein